MPLQDPRNINKSNRELNLKEIKYLKIIDLILKKS